MRCSCWFLCARMCLRWFNVAFWLCVSCCSCLVCMCQCTPCLATSMLSARSSSINVVMFVVLSTGVHLVCLHPPWCKKLPLTIKRASCMYFAGWLVSRLSFIAGFLRACALSCSMASSVCYVVGGVTFEMCPTCSPEGCMYLLCGMSFALRALLCC